MTNGAFASGGKMETPMMLRLSTITRNRFMTPRKLAPIHPGEILLHDFLEPMGVSQYRVAQDISVPARRINEIVHGTRRITADTALRLSRYFGTTERFWLNLQSRFDLEEQKDVLGNRLAKEVTVLRAAS